MNEMNELKEKKLNILKGKIKHINDIESQEKVIIPTKKKMLKAKAVSTYTPTPEQIKLRREKGMLVQLMYYINKRDFRLNNQ